MSYVRNPASRQEFVAAVKAKKLPVFFTQSFTALPIKKNGGVVMMPAMILRYSAQERSAGGVVEWVFDETVRSDASGRVELTNTVMQELEGAVPLQPAARPGGL